mmetsp:Transcript_35916/g.84982  ORF Transcript_35916/g.84982 Transcript_35916/m.84982 type:complete len:248 (+) Transcript_35916:698-1441(+)
MSFCVRPVASLSSRRMFACRARRRSWIFISEIDRNFSYSIAVWITVSSLAVHSEFPSPSLIIFFRSSRRMKRRSLRSTAPHAPRTSATSNSRPVVCFFTESTTFDPTMSVPRTAATMSFSTTLRASTATISSPRSSSPQICAELPGITSWICRGRSEVSEEFCASRMPTVVCVPRRLTSSRRRSQPSSSSSAVTRFLIASRSGIGLASGVGCSRCSTFDGICTLPVTTAPLACCALCLSSLWRRSTS